MSISVKRWQNFAAMAMIGDGVIALVNPEQYARAWEVGPEGWQCLMRTLREHPTMTRALAALEVAAGIGMAVRAIAPEKQHQA